MKTCIPDENTDPVVAVRYERYARLCAVAVAALGVVVLIGWALDIAALKSVVPGWAPMDVPTAIGFALAGVSLGAAGRLRDGLRDAPGWRNVHLVSAGALTLLGLLSLHAYFFALDFGIDHLSLAATTTSARTAAPGRMPVAVAAGLTFAGLALAFLDSRRGRSAFQAAALAGTLIGILGLVGHAYVMSALDAVAAYVDMAVHTAAGLVVVNLGTLLARPRRGLMGIVTSKAGGVMARRLLPLAFTAPFLIGWLRIEGEQRGYYSATVGTALVALLYGTLFAAFIWRAASVQRRSDQQRWAAAEQARRQHQAQLDGIIDSAMDAIIMVDDARRIVLFNPAAEQMFGYKAADLLGGPLDVLLPQRFRAEHVERTRPFGASGETTRRMGAPAMITGLRANGEEFATEASISRLEANGHQYVTAILRDVTESRRAELALRAAKAEAERANNAKSRFLAAASHDLRQPLSALGIYINVIDRHVTPAGQPLLANLKSCIGSLSELLTDLLDLSKLEAGVIVPKPSDFPIADVLASLASAHAPEAVVKGLRLRWVSSRLMVHTDLVLFKRMLGNLVDNAIRYTERGSVLVGCRRRQGKTWVEVRDTGIGIAAEHTGEIFEEFLQLGDGARSHGSGLGLAIVAKTAALLGLEISVRSWPGRGSVFAVELPPGQEPVIAALAPGDDVAYRALCVALVEDNAMVREAVAHALQYYGHQVVAAATGAELRAQLGSLTPDIVVSDYRLAQGETGFDVITAVRATAKAALPAIIITGDTDPQLMRSMADRGIAVVHKPLEMETLQAYLEDLTSLENLTDGATP